jgi:hydroxylaminobenzene mutase
MDRGHRLVQLGFLLFFIGLLTGLAIPALANPRMGLSSHLEGILNGLFLVALGIVWPRLTLSAGATAAAFWLALWGTYANWATNLLAALWGAGSALAPIAAAGFTGTSLQEGLIKIVLVTVVIAMLLTLLLVLWGLRRPADRSA